MKDVSDIMKDMHERWPNSICHFTDNEHEAQKKGYDQVASEEVTEPG